jgi:hypothetical protein
MALSTDDIIEIYADIHDASKEIDARKQLIIARMAEISPIGFKKVAFDTRRINTETEFNPRRGLQNYRRSEAFITEAMSEKIKNFLKLKKVLESIKEKYGHQSEWQDSYSRVLLNAINKAVRAGIDDGDYSEGQNSVGSLDYLEELLYVRYRLSALSIGEMSESKLEKIFLDKDENLTKKDPVKEHVSISKTDVSNQGYDSLLEKLFGGIKATKENPNVQRSVTITINDKFVED